MRFYLGTHKAHWLGLARVPLFVSHRTLAARSSLPRALAGWALDSGGFTELSTYGAWQTTPREYARSVRVYADEVGRLEWCAPQDWMVEPFILAKTGLTVADHQARTIASYLELTAERLPVVPVLQGWTLRDYYAHVEAYAAAGVELAALDRVGLGSVCRRQGTSEIARIVWALHGEGLRLHGFGVKTRGLDAYIGGLESADSLAWSYHARRRPPLPGCPHSNCANCLAYALRWRDILLGRVGAQASLLA